MKKISVILGTLAIGCVAMFTSCNNDSQNQSVTVTNWDSQVYAEKMNIYSYYYDFVGGSIESESKYNDYIVNVYNGCTVEWDKNQGNTNYTTYKFNIMGMWLHMLKKPDDIDILRTNSIISFNLLGGSSFCRLEEPVSICFDGESPFLFDRGYLKEGNIEYGDGSLTVELSSSYPDSDPKSMTLKFMRRD